MYEVFINHHSLILSNSMAESSYTQYDYNESFNWPDFIKNIPQKGALKLWVKSDEIESSWCSFKVEFKLILAAGGLVKKHQDYLFIYRNGKWDLPKGKLENNEDIAECAVREVEEECGIKDLVLEHKLIQTYHIYSMNDKMVLKETHWYLMNSSYSGVFVPQTEEGIEKVEWRSKNDIPELMKNSFSSIKKVIDSERN